MLASALSLQAGSVSSPNGDLKVNLSLSNGEIHYCVFFRGDVVLEESELGLITDIADFSQQLKNTGEELRMIDEAYELPHGKQSQVDYLANELTSHYETADGRLLDVVFRVSNRDVAFAYEIRGLQGEQRVHILKELSAYDFPEATTAAVTPQAHWGDGFARSKPSYEEAYKLDAAVTEKSETGLGYTFPALFHIKNSYWALLSETGTTGRYAATHLSDPDENGSYRIAFPDEAENNGMGASTVYGTLPLKTPWRTLTIGDSLAPIIETTVATDLVKPEYAGSRIYEPGRATWSWILWQDSSMNWDDQVTFIDLAAELGYEYILVDAWWDANIGRDRMKELVAYATSKKVEVILWYNSNGYWNDAYQTPRNCMDSAAARKREMSWLQSIGVKGLKVDFFGGDKQETMQLYEAILSDADTYGLHINFHGTTLPRGWERMFPNYMTSEAVLASENLVFSQQFADREAYLSTVYPFIRNTVGPMDYGPVFLSHHFSKDSSSNGNTRSTTDTFQLATAILYQSPLQHLGVTPFTLKEQPAYVIDFLKALPTRWDEVRYLGGTPGDYIILARRTGNTWYVAATHSSDESKTYTVSFPELSNKSILLYYDKADGSAGVTTDQLDTQGTLEITLSPKGGAVFISQ